MTEDVSAKEKFWLSSQVQDPLGKTSWTLGSKSPIHTEYLGFPTHSPYMQAARPGNQPAAASHCPSLVSAHLEPGRSTHLF